MAFRKIIKTGDPDDIRTGFAGAVWDIVKMSSLIGAVVAFFSGMVLKGKLLMLAAESWTSILLVLLVLFLALFLSLGAALLQLPGLIHRKLEHPEAQNLSDARLVLWVFSTFAVSWFSTFFFSVTSDITAEALRGFGMGEYLYDFPAALIFFYVAGPAIVVNVAFGSWVRRNIRSLLPEV